jgi:hypothetical protein
MKQTKIIKPYHNDKQIAFLDARQRIKFALCGRGFGKSYLIGAHNVDKLHQLPGSKSALVGMTYLHIQTKTLPVIKQCWRDYGMQEYDFETGEGDFVSFKKPPKKWIKNMLAPPDNFNYIISFPNGYHIELVSLANIDYHRGASFQSMDVDEAALCEQEDFTQVLSQTLRGFRHIFEGCSLYRSISLYTSIPWLPSGQWVYEFEKLAEQKPDIYLFMEGNARDNEEALGPDWIEEQRERLPEIQFRVEVMNERISKLPDCFYHEFEDKKHTISRIQINAYYRNQGLTNDQIDNLERLDAANNYQQIWEVVNTLGCTNYAINPTMPLDVSFDFNASINTLLIGQENKAIQQFTFFKELFVKYQSYLQLVDKFCAIYQGNPCKIVNVYGDRNGNKRDANNGLTYYEQIIQRFKQNGWYANHISTGAVEQYHNLRHYVVNELYAEKPTLPKVRYMQEGCKYTIISILNTPIKDNFKKDKSSEKNMKDRREEATDLSDASDYILYDKFGNKLSKYSEPMPIHFSK